MVKEKISQYIKRGQRVNINLFNYIRKIFSVIYFLLLPLSIYLQIYRNISVLKILIFITKIKKFIG